MVFLVVAIAALSRQAHVDNDLFAQGAHGLGEGAVIGQPVAQVGKLDVFVQLAAV